MTLRGFALINTWLCKDSRSIVPVAAISQFGAKSSSVIVSRCQASLSSWQSLKQQALGRAGSYE
jgi:hypothetical protein